MRGVHVEASIHEPMPLSEALPQHKILSRDNFELSFVCPPLQMPSLDGSPLRGVQQPKAVAFATRYLR